MSDGMQVIAIAQSPTIVQAIEEGDQISILVPATNIVEIIAAGPAGPKGDPGSNVDQESVDRWNALISDVRYTFTQISPSATWAISHSLNKYPSVTVVDSAETVVMGDIVYSDANNLTITFNSAFSGKAYLN